MGPPPKPLNVIALISGGKDSIYSLLHVLSLGHRVLALGNLYPQPAAHVTSHSTSTSTTTTSTSASSSTTPTTAAGAATVDDDAPDPDSHMYQTAGHALIPAIARALGLPLFRAPIVGGAVVGGSTYAPVSSVGGGGLGKEGGGGGWGGEGDETESLIPLLRAIKKAHPTADAGGGEKEVVKVRKPALLEESFEKTLKAVLEATEPAPSDLGTGIDDTATPPSSRANWETTAHPDRSTWTIVPSPTSSTPPTASEAMTSISAQLSALLTTHNLSITDIVSTTLLLSDMSTFASTNTIYASLFSAPNPPSRACVSVGALLPASAPVIMHVSLSSAPARRALHVQSRSYWAPANIGPYSQAQCAPLLPASPERRGVEGVCIAGQIPLVPATMEIVLALQHLWRVALAMDVGFFASGTAVMARCGLEVARRRARLAGVAWAERHRVLVEEEGEEEDVDLWELTNRRGEEMMGGERLEKRLPEWERVEGEGGGLGVSPFWAAEVESLPRGVDVEWLAGVGVVGESVKVRSEVSGSGGGVHECVVGGSVVITTVFVGYEEARVKGLEERVGELRGLLGGVSGKGALMGAEQVYLDDGIEGLWAEVGGNVIPCRSLWDREGTRLGAVVMFKSGVL
ncbi:hypothetical protein ACLOAV_008236 [Pseudogymnoascus australis]